MVLTNSKGTMLESFLTLPKADFGKLLHSVNSDDNVEKPQQAYRYTQVTVAQWGCYPSTHCYVEH